MECLTIRAARRLALVRAGLVKPEWTGFPRTGRGRGARARAAAHGVVRRFGYLQLDTVSIAGARSHAIVLLSRLEGFDRELAEELLAPGEPLFEYWGHEASWLPAELYPVFAFRREEYREHPWWGDVLGEEPDVTRRLLDRIRDEGPLRSVDLEGEGSRGWWDLKLAKRVANALWTSGDLAIAERRNFQRSYDLAERVVPDELRARPVAVDDAIPTLLLLALDGHGWATTGTLARTWRLKNRRAELAGALERLTEAGEVVPCALEGEDGRTQAGWVRPRDLELAARLARIRPDPERGVLLSPFDPVLWDRPRVRQLFAFDQVLEIFKPAAQRQYGYYCLPVLAGEALVARFDFKADRTAGVLRVLSVRFESSGGRRGTPVEEAAARCALERYAESVGLDPVGW